MINEEFYAIKGIVARTNKLAGMLNYFQGGVVKDGFAFYNASNPERRCWEMAVLAVSELLDIDAEDYLEKYLDELRARVDPQDAAREARINNDL